MTSKPGQPGGWLPPEDPNQWSSDTFLRAAKTGAFAVQPEHADQMIVAFEGLLATITDRLNKSRILEQPPPMSSTATAKWVSHHVHQSAVGPHGMLTQLEKARKELPKFIEALKIAKKHYHEVEDDTENIIKNLDPGHGPR